MKKFNLFLQGFKSEITSAVTPELKKELCDEAKILIADVVPGIWGTLAVLLVTEIESTIK